MLKLLIAAIAAPALVAMVLIAVAQASAPRAPPAHAQAPVLPEFPLDSPHPIGR